MKKIFTLISVALVAMSANAQEKYEAAPDNKLASEFAAVVDVDGNATNVVDGKSVVLLKTTNVTIEATGGATPANIDGGAQDITPGTALPDYVDAKGEAHPYAHEVASVGSWTNIAWKTGNQKKINDAAGTTLNFVMGTGNPYVNLLCEEIVTDETPTGNYRALYEYYTPGMEMPEVGLYYKIVPAVNGTMKIQVWANKGNRNTYLINGQTKEAVKYTAEGYINGQNTPDLTRPVYEEDGTTQKTDNDGNPIYEQVATFFTAEEIQAQHDAAKVNADGLDTAPYVIAAGNQAFWGWITFEAQAGVDYWLFQDSSQVGFGGFEFTATGGTGIQDVVAAQNADAPIYNLAGQQVTKNFRGVVIQNGKKFIQK